MTIVVRFGPPPFDLHPFVDAAIAELGYFRSDSAGELVALFEQLWPAGTSATMLIYNDLEPMADEEKRAVGLTKARMPRAVWSLLSDAGRADAWQAIKETTTHVILAVQCERARR